MKIIFATRLKSKRLERGFSQRELAKGICEQGQISRMEQGKYMPGSDLLYSLAQKLNVKMDYFFDEKIPVENSQIEKIRELVKTILIRRDYDTLKYIYEIEISKKSTLSLSDQIYIAWVESMVEFYSNNNRDRGRGILKELISRIGISNFNYLYLYNTQLNYFIEEGKKQEFEEFYNEISPIFDNLKIYVIEDLELYLKIKYNFCRYLWLNGSSEDAMKEIMEVLEICDKYNTRFLLADFYCLIGNVSEQLVSKNTAKKYFVSAQFLYNLSGNEKMALVIERYIIENF